jgi:hypothetical protein
VNISPNDRSDNNVGDIIFEELEEEISLKEIEDSIKTLKTGKSHGLDCIINQYSIVFKDILLPFLHTLFNAIFSTGYFSKYIMHFAYCIYIQKGMNY